VIKILQGSVHTQTTLGWLPM